MITYLKSITLQYIRVAETGGISYITESKDA